MRPLIRTEHPDNVNTLISELPRALRAARRRFAAYYALPLREVAASPVYTEGMASVAYVVAYRPGPPFSAQVQTVLDAHHHGWTASYNSYADYDSVEMERDGDDAVGYVQRDPQTGKWDAENVDAEGTNSGSLQFADLGDAIRYALTRQVSTAVLAENLGGTVEFTGDIFVHLTGGDYVAVTDDRPGWYYNVYNEDGEVTTEGEVHGRVEDVQFFVREAMRARGITPNI